MINRPFWIRRIEEAWKHRSLTWLAGVRRSGKTVLCRSLRDTEYFDCELPRIRKQMEDPEAFLSSLKGKRVVLDEVHRLPNPSELLKIATDHFPEVKIIATASSSLHASRKFRDTLTGRKVAIHLTPMNLDDFHAFGGKNISERLLRGGLPPFFLSPEFPERDFQEWMDSYWAKDIQELFRLEQRAAFQRFLELLFARSGGIFEATAFAAPCEVSRTTILNYLNVLELTQVCDVVRPYSTRKSSEIVSAPKVYSFDTGFVAYYRGWHELRSEDKGSLWEHLVLNEIRSRWPGGEVRYWRDKSGHEVDFILVRRGKPPIAVECKWSLTTDETTNMVIFRRRYPEGENWVISNNVSRPFRHQSRGLAWESLDLKAFSQRIEKF